MKNVNFIKPLPLAQTAAVRKWFLLSTATGIGTLALLGLHSFKQYTFLQSVQLTKRQLQYGINSFNGIMQQKQILKKEEKTLKERSNLILDSNKLTQLQAQFLINLKKILKNTTTLESFTMDSKTMQICVDCSQTQQAHEIIAALNQTPDFNNVHLNSLQPTQQGNTTALRLSLRGRLKYNSLERG